MTDFSDEYKNLLNARNVGERKYEMLVIEHESFSQTYYLTNDNKTHVFNDQNGIEREFMPANFQSSNAANDNDLTQTASFTISDLDNIFDDELQRWVNSESEQDIVATTIVYKSTLQDPIYYVSYEVKETVQNVGVFTLSCGAPNLNRDETGEKYTLDQFPALRGA